MLPVGQAATQLGIFAQIAGRSAQQRLRDHVAATIETVI